jgi:probable HAF family extracellular repeat protein
MKRNAEKIGMRCTLMAASSLLTALTVSWPCAEGQQLPPHYAVTALGTLGGTQGSAYGINNKRWVTGAANLQGDQAEHAVLWRDGVITDLGTLGGSNGSAGFPSKNDRGFIAAFGQTPIPDPLAEGWNFFCTLSGNLCQGTNLIQGGFLWVDGVKTPMPTLGGNNGTASRVNNLGQVVGFAENATVDPNCIAPQVLDIKAVMWSPWEHEIQELPPFSGDSVAGALAINDRGQVVGTSGSCAPISPAIGAHAVLWQTGSAVTYLGSLGGTLSNVAYDINNSGQVVGVSGLPGDATAHAFLWENGAMSDLGTLPGDFLSVAFSINDNRQVVGQSCDQSGNCRAFVWQNGVMTDLNAVVSHRPSLYLISANDINDLGDIVGQAFDPSTGSAPAFLATPALDTNSSRDEAAQLSGDTPPKVILPETVRKQLRQRRYFGLLGRGSVRPQ